MLIDISKAVADKILKGGTETEGTFDAYGIHLQA